MKKIINLLLRLFTRFEYQAKYAGVKLGVNNFIASRFWSSEPYLISIGNHCAITAGVKIFTHGGGRAVRNIYPKFDCFGKVSIGDYVYIGNNSLIMPGVSIGNNVIIAAGSVVTKSIPSGVVVGGNPARYICSMSEYLSNNLPYNLESKLLSVNEKKKLLLSIPDNKFIKKKELNISK